MHIRDNNYHDRPDTSSTQKANMPSNLDEYKHNKDPTKPVSDDLMPFKMPELHSG